MTCDFPEGYTYVILVTSKQAGLCSRILSVTITGCDSNVSLDSLKFLPWIAIRVVLTEVVVWQVQLFLEGAFMKIVVSDLQLHAAKLLPCTSHCEMVVYSILFSTACYEGSNMQQTFHSFGKISCIQCTSDFCSSAAECPLLILVSHLPLDIHTAIANVSNNEREATLLM